MSIQGQTTMEQNLQTEDYVIKTYNRYPIAFKEGKGAYLYDESGKKYLDLLCGLAVTSFGHAHHRINAAIKDQLDKLTHTSNLFHIPNQVALAKKISELSFKGRTFFCNSGTEANEAAIKFARLRGNSIRHDKNKILTLYKSFHGRTTGSIMLTGQQKFQEGFGPLMSGIDYISLNDINDLNAKFDDDVCMILLEPVLAESGVYPLEKEFVHEAKRLSEKYDALLVFDEVQTGIGRTAEFFGYQHFDVEPDAMTLAKALGNGLPIGALHVKDSLKDIFQPGKHAATFGGNPLVCRAALEVLKTLEESLDYVKTLSDLFKASLEDLNESFPKEITSIRQLGLIMAIEFTIDAKVIHKQLLDHGIIVNVIGDHIIRLLPPFIIGSTEITLFFDTLKKILTAL